MNIVIKRGRQHSLDIVFNIAEDDSVSFRVPTSSCDRLDLQTLYNRLTDRWRALENSLQGAQVYARASDFLSVRHLDWRLRG